MFLRLPASLFALCVFFLAHHSSAQAQSTLTTLYNFTGYPGDGDGPVTGVVAGNHGVLYGTTYLGGIASGEGTVFELIPPASAGGAWTENILHEFIGSPGDGQNPVGLVVGAGGVLYVTTLNGGTFGYGAVVQLTPPATAGAGWTENVLYSFSGADGALPEAGVVVGSRGELYGTTRQGGSGVGPFPCSLGCGTVFELMPPTAPGGNWTETVLYNFTVGSGGIVPYSNLIIVNGTLYGTASQGGITNCPNDCGTVFELTPPSVPGGPWVETTVYSFQGRSDGYDPFAGLVAGSDGALYGTTVLGGASNYGTVYRLTPPAQPGEPWIKTTLHSFERKGANYGNLAIGKNGALYGNAIAGAIFGLEPPTAQGSGWSFFGLHRFTGNSEPNGALIIGANGAIYGTTISGGTDGYGTVFELKL